MLLDGFGPGRACALGSNSPQMVELRGFEKYFGIADSLGQMASDKVKWTGKARNRAETRRSPRGHAAGTWKG